MGTMHFQNTFKARKCPKAEIHFLKESHAFLKWRRANGTTGAGHVFQLKSYSFQGRIVLRAICILGAYFCLGTMITLRHATVSHALKHVSQGGFIPRALFGWRQPSSHGESHNPHNPQGSW